MKPEVRPSMLRPGRWVVFYGLPWQRRRGGRRKHLYANSWEHAMQVANTIATRNADPF